MIAPSESVVGASAPVPTRFTLRRQAPVPSVDAVPVSDPPVSAVAAVPRRTLFDLTKRGVDILVASLGLIVLAPLVPVIAMAIYVESPGPVFFRHHRLGRARRRFAMLKFRSMHTDAEAMLHADEELHAAFKANGYKFPAGEDPRITRVGSLLRATSLDELPQLFNVLRGDMSLIGPRPPIIDQVTELYGDDEHFYFAVRPGLTGLWQVSGRSDLSPDQRRQLDIQYVQGRSVRTDLRILVKTVPAVLRQDGAC